MRSSRVGGVLALVLSVVGQTPASTAASPGGYLRPVRGPIIRHFEPPPTPYSAGHRGIDMAVSAGTTVVAAQDGVVTFAGFVAGERYVSIDHLDGIRTTYSYLSAIVVTVGRNVTRGEPIGATGTGHPSSTQPPHLHFGARVGDEYIDPEALLLDGLRRDLSQAIRLIPIPSPPVAHAAAR